MMRAFCVNLKICCFLVSIRELSGEGVGSLKTYLYQKTISPVKKKLYNIVQKCVIHKCRELCLLVSKEKNGKCYNLNNLSSH